MKLNLAIMLLFSGMAIRGATISDTYPQLQKNPRYRKMSLLEIAIDRGDLEAIRYYEFRATVPELKKARVLLQNKVNVFDANIKDYKEEFLSGPEKGTTLVQIDALRGSKADFESLLREFNRKLEEVDKADAARAAAAEKEASKSPQAAPAA